MKDKYIYAIDIMQKAVLVFDKKGNFVSKLDKRGQGPEEYNTIGPPYILMMKKSILSLLIIEDRKLRN